MYRAIQLGLAQGLCRPLGGAVIGGFIGGLMRLAAE